MQKKRGHHQMSPLPTIKADGEFAFHHMVEDIFVRQ